jgi:hypothetical protein
MKINVETHYLEHVGGTKFYETVLLTLMDGPTIRSSVLIKRYGKVEYAVNGSGQTILEYGDEHQMRTAAKDIFDNKTRRGGYLPRKAPEFGLHSVAMVRDLKQLRNVVSTHYSKPDTVKEIIRYFSGETTATPIAEPAPRVDEIIDRGELWGAF